VNFLRRLALQEKQLDDSLLLDVAEIARVPDVLPSCFLPGRAKELISTPLDIKKMNQFVRKRKEKNIQ